MTSSNFKTLDIFDTELFADSVEWCPIEPFTNTFVCGTYQLSSNEGEEKLGEAEPKKRIGRIYLFRVIGNGKLDLLQRLDVPGVLDMKWMHVDIDQKILLGVANSAGYVQVYQLAANAENASLILISEKRINEGSSDVLALSLDWSSGKFNTDERNVRIVVSDSKGSISMLKLLGESLEKVCMWEAHDYEAWIAAFDYWNTNVVYTGGDDCKLKWFDVRMNSQPAGVNRIHGAGVTSLHSNATQEFLLASGSYDENLRLWDVRKMRNPLSEINLNGGIWRLKWDPKSHNYLIAACMYGGFRIIDCIDNGRPNVLGQYMEHQSISYGCDWSFMGKTEIEDKEIIDRASDTEALIATCSFYDHALRLATVNLNKLSQ